MPESRETIGQRLRQIRLSRQISIEKAADATHIRVQYLQALETDDYSAMSSAAQGRGFLRLYADYLGLDLEATMLELREIGTTISTPDPELPIKKTSTQETTQTIVSASKEDKPTTRPFWKRLLKRSVPGDTEQVESPPDMGVKAPEKSEDGPVQTSSQPEAPFTKKDDKKKDSIQTRLKRKFRFPRLKLKLLLNKTLTKMIM